MKLEIPLLTSAIIGFWGAEAAPLTSTASQQAIEWSVSYQGHTIFEYSFAPQKFKPYVKVLATVDGFNLLRDAPSDHLHHHALMYGIKVNGINFWEEVSGSGIQKPVNTDAPKFDTNPQGQPRATLHQTVHWLSPADAWLPDTTKLALLVEERTLKLTVNEKSREVALEWESVFTVGTKTNEVGLTGSSYHGLGMRFVQTLDPLARHFNADGPPDLSNGKQDVSPHRWASVSFEPAGHPATIAVLGDPNNTRGNPKFFTMLTPFAYLSATQGLDKEPLIYHTGQQFSLRYLVVVYPELKSPASLDARGQSWSNPPP